MSQGNVMNLAPRGHGSTRSWGFYASILVLIAGPLLQIATGGAEQLGRANFWFGLYGWLAAAIVIGYLVSLIQARVAPRAEPEPVASSAAALPVGASVEAGELP